MKQSIRRQLTVIFISLMTLMFLANFLINAFFLEDFYILRKRQVLMDAYRILNTEISDSGLLDEEEIQEFGRFCNSNGMSFIVLDGDGRRLYWLETYADIVSGRLGGYRLGIDVGSVLEQNDKYTIQKKYDTEIGLNYLEMWGMLDKGFAFILRINIESIRESVSIANEFIKYICLAGIVLTAIIVQFITRKVTKPISELTELSKRMAELDFEAKYTGGGEDEIGQLGEHFNQMSEKLERAYSELLTANNELQKDIERKEQIDDMIKEFLSNVSHELKTPIALIQGYAEGLQECINDDAESREFYCEVIMDEASRMNGLVQKLLTLNQLEFGNDQVVMERFDIMDLIRNKVQSVSILAQQKEAHIIFHDEGSVFVWGDEFKVEEVLTNYLSNALNHVSGDHRIEISVRPHETSAADPGDSSADSDRNSRENTTVRISVFNTGEQIPEEDIDLIWDKFYKVDKARTREYGGSGVGLSIVKAIMESFHQQYGVLNREDGVEFWFELQNGDSMTCCEKDLPEIPENVET